MNFIDDQTNEQPQPGSLNFVPQPGPEASIESIAPSIETAPKQENEPIYTAPVENKPETKPEQPVVTNTTPQTEAPKVNDKTVETSPVHHIAHPQDKLTEHADKDEEEFILGQKTAHGRK